MRRLVLGSMLMVCMALVIQAKPQAGEIITVKVENEAKAAKSKLTVRFTELVEDSRCPKGTNCVWDRVSWLSFR